MTKAQKTTLVKDKDIVRKWHVLDASEYTLGRLATRAAHLLSGKHKTSYAPHQDGGDFVVIVNAKKVKFSNPARKATDKKYYSFSGYSGGLRTETLAEKLAKDPSDVIMHAVRGMLDANRLRKLKLRRLKIVEGTTHQYPVKKD